MAQTTCVEIISRETIKPSSPTPQHLQKMHLSYLDQLLKPIYISLIIFYQSPSQPINRLSNLQTSQRLKKSLSHTLTLFYPLAGRIQDNFIVDCNDSGFEFIDARAVEHTLLIEATQDNPNIIDEDHLKQYLPVDPTTTTKPLFLVQITYIDNGGVVFGIRFSHRIADCASIINFINVWAHANETDSLPTPPHPITFDLANYFAGTEFPIFDLLTTRDEKFMTKRFVFDEVKLSALRRLADSNVEKPTRVELISAFIWKNPMQFSSSSSWWATHAVNLRARKKCLENVFGNCFMVAFASDDLSSGGGEFHEVVSKLRSAISRVDEDYITKSSQQSGEGGILNDLNEFVGTLTKGQVEKVLFSSWCRFPIYEADFGWGKPSWFCPAEVQHDMVNLMSSRCGERIEAWVNMKKDALSMLEA
ncbi:hypothetical protein CASFOL_025085 [Castilleja foliolosa]|uniref:Uncharacterized protein n=1 Tax=Castilleja foliolosa TaxID=1961234 RepID=A0ABD3CS06_9LAMI